jgi:hypothetical protein
MRKRREPQDGAAEWICRVKSLFTVLGAIEIKLRSDHGIPADCTVLEFLEAVERKQGPSPVPVVGLQDPAKLARLLTLRNAIAHGQTIGVSDEESSLILEASSQIDLALDKQLALRRSSSSRLTHLWRSIPSYPRVWRLLQYLLSHKARRETFQPSYDELLADYYTAMREYRSRSARAWLRFCFAARTVVMLLECYRVSGIAKILRLVPVPLRRWWIG